MAGFLTNRINVGTDHDTNHAEPTDRAIHSTQWLYSNRLDQEEVSVVRLFTEGA